MAHDKSLAAEIEANQMTLEQALAYLKPADANKGTISLRAPKAREAVAVIAAEIAALQSRAFEDGARWMRERAASEAETVWEWIPSECADEPYEAIALEIRHLPLQPEGERNV